MLTVGDEEEVDLTEYKSSVEASLGALKPDSIALKRVRRLPDRMPRGKLRDEIEIINEICHEELGFELERDTQARNERLVGALQIIRDEIERNISLCKQIHEELSSNGAFVQYYNLRTTIWQTVSSALVDLKSPDLSKQIANEYFDYEHLKRRIDARFE